MRDSGKICHPWKRCTGCDVPMLNDATRCAVCDAFDAGHRAFWESLRFHVTSASISALFEWHAGNWIPNEIVESHRTFKRAREAVVRLNEESDGLAFYFITADREMIRGR
jgi:hypothetical protein